MEDLQDDVQRLRQAGMEKAASLWELLVGDSIQPVDIFKVAATMKCAEFVRGARAHDQAAEFLRLIKVFFDEAMTIAGKHDGSAHDGARALRLIEEAVPLTEATFYDADAYAERQHMFEGLLMLSAARMGKESEVRKAYALLHAATANLIIRGYGIDPDAPAQA